MDGVTVGGCMVFCIIFHFPFYYIWIHYCCDALKRKGKTKRSGEEMGGWD